MDAETLSQAMAIWTGWGSRSFPTRDDDAVVRAFGATAGLDVLRRLKAYEAEFYTSTAHTTAPDLATMGEQAAADFRRRQPDAPEAVVDALTWCYTFDWK
ncbi:hypothetical protein ACFP8W_04065 [Nocardioides hankookensis]|uniref:Uncharacterized protein n=1 Tax=Nocardioides hankookensis TaxID=443157 RepID=A0ABW1LPP3_9ACTN